MIQYKSNLTKDSHYIILLFSEQMEVEVGMKFENAGKWEER